MKTNINIMKSLTLIVMLLFFSCGQHENESKQTSNNHTEKADSNNALDHQKAENVKTQFVSENGVKYAYRIIGDTKKRNTFINAYSF